MTDQRDARFSILAEALKALLGAPADGAMAFTRSLPTEVVLAADRFAVAGWLVFGVHATNRSASVISSDRAVDLREKKAGCVLLLVDPKDAGAGMDGIFSAVREISEEALFSKAADVAMGRLSTESRKIARHAMQKARKLGKHHSIAPWRHFDFLAACAAAPEAVGQHVALLGLWPIEAAKEDDLDMAATLVERLLLTTGSANTVQARVESLLLPEGSEAQAEALAQFLRDASPLRWADAVLLLRDRPTLWVNRLLPGIFSEQVRSITCLPWRTRPETPPLAWSGLKPGDDDIPVFYVSETAKTALEVRWKTEPRDVKPGSVEYQVAVITGSEEVLAIEHVSHSARDVQKCKFVAEHFAELDRDGKWEAIVRVTPVGDELQGISARTEEFIVVFGEATSETRSTVGRKVRSLVDEVIRFENEDEYTRSCAMPLVETKGHISVRVAGKSARVFRPAIVRAAEESWRTNDFKVGRWIVRVRDDGSAESAPVFHALEGEGVEQDVWKRVEDATRALATRAAARQGFIGMVYRDMDLADKYVNSWSAALETGDPVLALANTLEVQTLSGRRVGIIVLPSHPVRVAWHQAFDELAFHARYRELLPASKVVQTLAALDGSHFPAFLPGVGGEDGLVFGDTLGFHCVGMIPTNAAEPQASIAQLARCLSDASADVAPSVGVATGKGLAREVERYEHLHPDYLLLRINSLRAGDGRTTVRALGLVTNHRTNATYGRSQDEENLGGHAYDIRFFPSEEQRDARVVGRHLAEIAERRRTAGALIPEEDRWVLESVTHNSLTIPRLRWSKASLTQLGDPAHISIAFDVFDSQLVAHSVSKHDPRPMEAFGLFAPLLRTFTFDPLPTWISTIAPTVDGIKHPVSRALSDRLHKVHSAVLKCAAPRRGEWPARLTVVDGEKADLIARLHGLSDWVVTVDRNAGLEYFDSPKDNSEVYDTYLIDCVPERHDLQTVQIVTSTTQISEVMQLVDDALAQMALSCSPRNCEFLLAHLKALSGRLAMRLANRSASQGELIALALFYATCLKNLSSFWPSPSQGFFVPVDDIRDLLGPIDLEDEEAEGDAASAARADLLYVSLSRRGSLDFASIEIKYRRLLKSAKDPTLRERILVQTTNTLGTLQGKYFASTLSPTQAAIRRKTLARALQFYADKARRHGLDADTHLRLTAGIEKLVRSDGDISFAGSDCRGFIFCPEHVGPPELLESDGALSVTLFGPETIPDRRDSVPAPDSGRESQEPPAPTPRSSAEEASSPSARESDPPAAPSVLSTPIASAETALEVVAAAESSAPIAMPSAETLPVVLGQNRASDVEVGWAPSIRGNPHLMIVGLPGMGKTTSIIDIAVQMLEQGIVPIVFAYHADLEERLQEHFHDIHLVDLESGLGFNPLVVTRPGPHAWVDNVGMVRDIFSAIYRDLGDLQTEELRQAIKESYTEKGFGVDAPAGLAEPSFARFFEILQGRQKPNVGLMARLHELGDYGFFKSTSDAASLLTTTKPVVIRIHATQNDLVQNALASFILLNIYQNMFIRGEQSRLTHAVIFDEAHRASRLRLLPTMAKECRKFGISLVVSSQAAKDFDSSLYSAVANYLILRVTEGDARVLAKIAADGSEAARLAGQMKTLDRYTAFFVTEGKRPRLIELGKKGDMHEP